MPFHDLNLTYTTDHSTLSNTLHFAKELGYSTIALSISVTGKLPTPLPSIPVSSLPKPNNLTLLTRLTLTISDTTQNHRLPTLATHYDLIALRPTTKDTFQQCCSNLECDLISLDFSQRLNYPIKFKTVASALQRGIRFEICYSPGIVNGNDARRNLISGATQLIRATRGRGIVASSEAKSALGVRAPWDVMNLAVVWGSAQQRAKEALCEEAEKVVRFARLKRSSYRGVVDIIDDGLRKTQDVQKKVNDGTEAVQGLDEKPKANASKQHRALTSNGIKRKASASSLNNIAATQGQGDKPLSKNQAKKLAKKAKMEGRSIAVSALPADNTLKNLPIQHETIKSNEPK